MKFIRKIFKDTVTLYLHISIRVSTSVISIYLIYRVSLKYPQLTESGHQKQCKNFTENTEHPTILAERRKSVTYSMLENVRNVTSRQCLHPCTMIRDITGTFATKNNFFNGSWQPLSCVSGSVRVV